MARSLRPVVVLAAPLPMLSAGTGAAQAARIDPGTSADVKGICILGDVNFETGEVIREVRDVMVSGFTIRGFSEGTVVVSAHDATFERNVTAGNAEYRITAFSSTGTRMLFNRASGSGEAGFYIGKSPVADATRLTTARGVFHEELDHNSWNWHFSVPGPGCPSSPCAP